jgi:hypothetical protein
VQADDDEGMTAKKWLAFQPKGNLKNITSESNNATNATLSNSYVIA